MLNESVTDEAVTEAIIKDLSRITELMEKPESMMSAEELAVDEELGLTSTSTRIEAHPTRSRKSSI